MVIFYWFSVLTLGAENGGSQSSLLAFVGIILFTFFSIDLLKIIGAKKLRPLLTRSLLVALNKLIGTVFVGFGIVLIIQGILGLLVTK
jgi:threonine/homoserine/homoserine lactone efflux protein